MSALEFHHLLRWCRWLLKLMATLAALRLGYVAWNHREKTVILTPVPKEPNAGDPGALGSPQAVGKSIVEGLKLRPAPLPSELLQQLSVPAQSASTAPKKPPVTRVYLTIDQRLPRTEVRLNGVTLGHTPFVGEISCTHGDPLEFVLIPPKGMPRRSHHICDRTEINLTDQSTLPPPKSAPPQL